MKSNIKISNGTKSKNTSAPQEKKRVKFSAEIECDTEEKISDGISKKIRVDTPKKLGKPTKLHDRKSDKLDDQKSNQLKKANKSHDKSFQEGDNYNKNGKKKKNKKQIVTAQNGRLQVVKITTPSERKRLERVNNDKRKRARSVDANELPKTYTCAAEALKLMSERGGSAGSIVVRQFRSYNVKHIYAIVMNCVKNIAVTKKLIYETKLMKFPDFKDVDSFMLEILVSELLFGRGLKELGKVPLAKKLIDRKPVLDEKRLLIQTKNAASLKLQAGGQIEDKKMDAKYLRINTLKNANLDQILKELKTTFGLEQLEYSKEKIKFKKFIAKFRGMRPNQFMVDFHFPNDLIVLKLSPDGTNANIIKKSDLYKKGKIVFQDKASFLAVEAMQLKSGMCVIDACCAPGMKTAAIAAKLKNRGQIYAIDKDKSRLGDTDRLLKKLGVTCCRTLAQDFSKVKFSKLLPTSNAKVDVILIDPSCSGSGIHSRPDYRQSCEEQGRLKKLQAFQVAMLVHAIDSNKSDAIVYCTCSTSVEENEQVIKMSLDESKFGQRWQVVPCVPYWPVRGAESEQYSSFSSYCVRSSIGQLTNGFFIARLERRPVTEEVPPEVKETSPTESDEIEPLNEETDESDDFVDAKSEQSVDKEEVEKDLNRDVEDGKKDKGENVDDEIGDDNNEIGGNNDEIEDEDDEIENDEDDDEIKDEDDRSEEDEESDGDLEFEDDDSDDLDIDDEEDDDDDDEDGSDG